MQRISRATDDIWAAAAFDPRKPVDPDWATKEPAPILRSGDEQSVFGDSPSPHNHSGDAMVSAPISGEDYLDNSDDDYEPDGSIDRMIPDHDLSAMGQHHMDLVTNRSGRIEGSQGHYVEYPTGSSVSHYYTYHPNRQWSLQSSHMLLRDPLISHHSTFKDAADRAKLDRVDMESQADREFPE